MSLIHRIGAFLHSPSGQHRSRKAAKAEPAAPQQPGPPCNPGTIVDRVRASGEAGKQAAQPQTPGSPQ